MTQASGPAEHVVSPLLSYEMTDGL